MLEIAYPTLSSLALRFEEEQEEDREQKYWKNSERIQGIQASRTTNKRVCNKRLVSKSLFLVLHYGAACVVGVVAMGDPALLDRTAT